MYHLDYELSGRRIHNSAAVNSVICRFSLIRSFNACNTYVSTTLLHLEVIKANRS